MQSLSRGSNLTVKSIVNTLAYISVFIYIVSAICFELMEDTAFISTIAIYFVFAVGLLFIITSNRAIINQYVVLFSLFAVYVFVMTIAPDAHVTEGSRIAYVVFTCVVLCILVFWMSLRLENIVSVAVVAYIIGALMLVFRVIEEYGGLSEILKFVTQDGENRVGGLLGNENEIGLYFSTAILCSLLFFIKSKKVMVKVLMIAAILVFGMMMLLTGSRKALAFALIAIVLMVLLGYRTARFGNKATAIAVLIFALIVIYVLITTMPMFATINERVNLLFEGFFGSDNSYETDNLRQYMIERGLEAFYQRPLFGHGTGYSHTLFGTYSHNNFVELLMCYGLVGFCLYYSFYVILVIKLFRQAMKSDLYAIFFFVYTCIQFVLDVGAISYYSRPVQILTALAFGYVVSLEMGKNIGARKDEIKESV